MKQARILILAVWFAISGVAWAQDAGEESDPAAPPPIPPKVPGEEVEPSVVITEREGERRQGEMLGDAPGEHATFRPEIAPESRVAGGGAIVNLSSMAGQVGLSRRNAYGAAKAGVEMFTRALAKEVQGSGVIVTFYSPGLGATGLTVDDPRMDSIAPHLHLGSLCTPKDVAPIVAFLDSELSDYFAASR